LNFRSFDPGFDHHTLEEQGMLFLFSVSTPSGFHSVLRYATIRFLLYRFGVGIDYQFGGGEE
jgi:hypothetical protein